MDKMVDASDLEPAAAPGQEASAQVYAHTDTHTHTHAHTPATNIEIIRTHTHAPRLVRRAMMTAWIRWLMTAWTMMTPMTLVKRA
jgi:hypothetical protein